MHGARSVLLRAKLLAQQGVGLNRLQAWAVSLDQRVGHNKAACALANKLARVGWAMWSRGGDFDPGGATLALAA